MFKASNRKLQSSDERGRARFSHSSFGFPSDFGFRISDFSRGFSLTEVMFAVIVLGIGFILIAAIFPVSISQSRLTIDETTAAANARSAMALTSRVVDGGDISVSGRLVPTTDLFTSPPATAQ